MAEHKNPNELLLVKDEEGNEAKMVRSAFEKVWSDRGWTLVEDESRAAPHTQPRRQPDTSGTGTTKNEE